MDKIKVFHYGCSFTQNFKDNVKTYFNDNFSYINYGKESKNNFYILDKFKSTATSNSISIIQWTSLTRPLDDNYKIIEISDNPLFDLLEEWYLLIEEAINFSVKNNIKLIQYIGWAEWKDRELNDYHRKKLNSFGITWFQSKEQQERIPANCFQLQPPYLWSSTQLSNGMYEWEEIKWGGMSEWCRENINIDKRYVGYIIDGDKHRHDPHPSEFSTIEFVKNVLIPKVNLILHEKYK